MSLNFKSNSNEFVKEGLNSNLDSYKLKELMKNQLIALKELLDALEQQHEQVAKNDVFKMDACVEKIQICNQKIANIELQRRALTKEELQHKSMGQLIEEIGDNELEQTHTSIKTILHEIKLQKDTNELLIKQGLAFTNKMLVLLNPDRQAKTYNAYGKMRK